MKTLFLAIFVAAAIAVPARAQDSSSTAAAGTSAKKESKSSGSAHAQVGERAPGDASSSTSAEGRPRAGIEVGTASATQGGRTDNGTPPRHTGATERSAPGTNPSQPEDQASTANNSANRAQRQGATEDQEFNRIPGQDATMMTEDQQKKEASAAKKRGAARKDSSIVRSKGSDAPNPDADKSTTGNRKE